jgi:type I restriction enzyme S subunit
VERLPIPLPPVVEQHRIIADLDCRLSLVREVEVEADANLNLAEAFRQGTLNRAFGAAANAGQ